MISPVEGKPRVNKAKLKMREGFRGGPAGKESACNTPGSFPGSGRPPEKEMATHGSIFARETPWTDKPGGLQSRNYKSQTCFSN